MRILKQASVLIGRILMKVSAVKVGSVAQWITRLTTDQKIPGSTPGWLGLTFPSESLKASNWSQIEGLARFIQLVSN